MAIFKFYSTNGLRSLLGQEVVLPILRYDDDGKVTCIGTGFYISRHGIIATAAHVVMDILDSDYNQVMNASGEPRSGIFTFQFSTPNDVITRLLVRGACHKKADVAVAIVETDPKKSTAHIEQNESLPLTTYVPQPDEEISTWAYPNVTTELKIADSSRTSSLFVRPKHYEGKLKREFRFGRDQVIMPGPCYETNLGIEGGASGGPVFDKYGHVFAINSSGIQGTDVAHVSHIQSIGGLVLKDPPTGKGVLKGNITISELIERREIIVMKS